jgi:hypothetical protein
VFLQAAPVALQTREFWQLTLLFCTQAAAPTPPLHWNVATAAEMNWPAWATAPRASEPFVHVEAPHEVPNAAALHAPAPSQPPARQVATDAGHAASAVLMGLAKHAPACPEMLQDWQVPQEGAPQHTPSTQLPLPQSVPTLQVAPFGRTTHAPALHILPVPQLVPLATFDVNTQTDTPVAHDVEPFWQTLPPGVQPWLGVQLTHVPPEQ